METQTIKRNEAVRMIRQSNGKLFSVTFFKRSTGSKRRMTARLGVKKGVTGEGMAFNPKDHDLIPVYEFLTSPDTVRSADGKFLGGGSMGGQFRMISIEGLLSLKIGGRTYTVAD